MEFERRRSKDEKRAAATTTKGQGNQSSWEREPPELLGGSPRIETIPDWLTDKSRIPSLPQRPGLDPDTGRPLTCYTCGSWSHKWQDGPYRKKEAERQGLSVKVLRGKVADVCWKCGKKCINVGSCKHRNGHA